MITEMINSRYGVWVLVLAGIILLMFCGLIACIVVAAKSYRNMKRTIMDSESVTEESAMIRDFLTITVSDNIVDILVINLDTYEYVYVFHEEALKIRAIKGEIPWGEFLENMIPRIHPLDRAKVLDVASKRALDEYSIGTVKNVRFRMSYNVKTHTFSNKGKYFWYTSNVRVWERNGQKSAVISTIDETVAIEEERKRQEMLEEALKNARRAGQAKSTFLFNMSHDIRTPMNAILGFTAISKKHLDDPEKMEDCLEKIESSGNHLLRLINDILEMSSIEYGKVTMEPSPCDLVSKMEKIAVMIQGEMEKKNLHFEYQAEVTDPYVMCDELHMDQIVLNLLGNAVKFTGEGGHIWYRVQQCGKTDDGRTIYEWHIKDDGIGMDAEFQNHMFDPFERERSSTDSGVQGTGLGLSITKSLVKLMGGNIHVISKKGEGSEFIISVPLELAESDQIEDMKVSAKYDFSGKRVLLVEDNELNAEIAEELLQDEGFIVELAGDGATAVRKVMDKEADYFDLILMDIQMPVLDGYQATRAIRSLEDEKKAAIPIIAMTANAFEEDKKKALECGMQAHVAKPIVIANLLETIDYYVK